MLKGKMKAKLCKGCPFNDGLTEEASYAQNMGCLASKFDIINIKKETGHNWACHDNNERVCQGLVKANKDNNLGFDMSQGKLYLLPGNNCNQKGWKPEDLEPILK